MSTVLNVVGVAFEAIGVGLAAFGTWQTWRDWGPEGEGIADPIVVPINHALVALGRWAAALTRRVLRKPAHRRVVTGTADLTVGFATHARARVQFGVLPADVAVRGAITELDRRTRLLMDGVSDRKEEIEDGLAGVRAELQEANARLEEALETVSQQTRRVATGGVRLGMLGLAIVALGLLFQGVSAIV